LWGGNILWDNTPQFCKFIRNDWKETTISRRKKVEMETEE